jgi:serine/threonine-protein kinase
MLPQRLQEVEELFEQALELPAGERAAFVAAACGGDAELRQEVEALLAADAAAGDFLEQPPHTAGAAALAEAAGVPATGRRIGPYRLLRCLGAGGMGTVFLAQRVDEAFHKQVAIKLVHRDASRPALLRRFQVERQILATLEHPNIARVLDGGTTEDGLQYLVLEYVEGLPIDLYCDRHRLPIAERLELLRQVCAAVHYAHRHLVVHRDLKPSNVLVTAQGVPKLLDFGIAKLLDAAALPAEVEPTRTGVRLLTPHYASPEQVRGEAVTTAADTYALGVLLYQLLTGRLPFGSTTRPQREVERAVCEERPPKPSEGVAALVVVGGAAGVSETGTGPAADTVARNRGLRPEALRRRLAGDLDRIVFKALRKEPERRYASAAELSEDLQRHLVGLPVRARPDTAAYRLRKFLRRHRLAAALAALLAVALAGFATSMAVQAAQIARQRDRAAAERDKARQVVQLLQEVFQVAAPGGSDGPSISAQELLDQGVEKVGRRLAHQPELRGELLTTLGTLYYNLALFERAEATFRQAIASQQEALGEESMAVAETLTELANSRMSLGDFAAAEQILRRSLDIKRGLVGDDDPSIAWGLVALGSARRGQGDHKESEALYRQALDLQRHFSAEDDPALIPYLYALAVALQDRGDYDGAEAHYRQAYELQRRAFGDDHPDTVRYLGQIGTVLDARGEYAAAQEIFEQVVAQSRQLLGDDHPDLAHALVDAASVMESRGDTTGAVAAYREALAIMRRSLGDDHPETVWSIYGLAALHERQGELERAEALYREALEHLRRALGDDHVEVTLPLAGLGEVLRQRGQAAAAEPLLRQAVAVRRRSLPADNWRIAAAEAALGRALSQLGRFDEAEPLLVASHRRLAEVRGEEHRLTQRAVRGLIAHFEARGDEARADEFQALLVEPAPAER